MFQGGQNGIATAVPKARGFKSLRTPAQVVYSDHLNNLSGTVDNFALYEAGLIETPFHSVKVITRGELTAKLVLQTQGASKSVVAALEAAGAHSKRPPRRAKPHANKPRQRTLRKKHFLPTQRQSTSRPKRCFVPEETLRIDARSKIYLYAIGFAKKITTRLGVADCSQARNIVTHVPVLYWISATPTIILAHPSLLI